MLHGDISLTRNINVYESKLGINPNALIPSIIVFKIAFYQKRNQII